MSSQVNNYIEILTSKLKIKKPKIVFDSAKEEIDYSTNTIYLVESNKASFDLYYKIAYKMRILAQKPLNLNFLDSKKDAKEFAREIMEKLFDVTPVDDN